MEHRLLGFSHAARANGLQRARHLGDVFYAANAKPDFARSCHFLVWDPAAHKILDDFLQSSLGFGRYRVLFGDVRQ